MFIYTLYIYTLLILGIRIYDTNTISYNVSEISSGLWIIGMTTLISGIIPCPLDPAHKSRPLTINYYWVHNTSQVTPTVIFIHVNVMTLF